MAFRPSFDSDLWWEIRPPSFEEPLDLFGEPLELGEPIDYAYFSDTSAIWDSEYHGQIFGVPRSGKTNFLLRLEYEFLKRGWLVIHRDDMDTYNWLRMLNVIKKIVVWVPKGCKLSWYKPPPADVEVKIKHYEPDNIYADIIQKLSGAYAKGWRYHVIMYDSFIGHNYESLANIVRFYCDFLLGLISWAARRPYERKIPIMLGYDELNDLIPPRGKSITETHENLREALVFTLRKIGKHKIKIFGTAHRVNQVAPDIRAQAHLFFFTTTPVHDAYDFLNKLLIYIDNETFFTILKRLRYLPTGYLLYIDYRGMYDWAKFNYLPEPPAEIELSGTIGLSRRKQFDEKDIAILILRLQGYTFRDIADAVDLSLSTTYKRWYKITENDALYTALVKAEATPIERMVKKRPRRGE